MKHQVDGSSTEYVATSQSKQLSSIPRRTSEFRVARTGIGGPFGVYHQTSLLFFMEVR